MTSAANGCRVWRDWLGEQPPSFSTLAEFAERVPVINRHDLFTRPWPELVHGGDLGRVDRALLSSGSTGSCRAVGLLDARTRVHESTRLRAALVELVPIGSQPTVLINTLPDGVALDLPGIACVATGARALLAVEYLAQFGATASEIILVGEPSTLLAVLHMAQARGIVPSRGIWVVSGGDFLSEDVRAQMCSLLGIDPRAQPLLVPLSSFGLAEVGMHILWETPTTVLLRRLLARDPAQLAGVCAGTPGSLPCVMTWDPEHVHVEIVAGELILTRLEPDLLQPVIRYNTHDRCGHVDLERAIQCLMDAHLEAPIALPERLIWLDSREIALTEAESEAA